MFQFNGQTIHEPSAVGVMIILAKLGVTFPEFNVGLIVAKSMKGAPYNSSPDGDKVMLPYDSENALLADYGCDDIHKYFRQMQKQYNGAVFLLNAQPNTPVEAVLQDITPTNSLKMKALPKNWGVFGNDCKINVADSADEDSFIESGTATSSTNTTLVNSTKTWTTNAFVGKYVKITGGTGYGQIRKITANNGTALTVAAWGNNPDATSTYTILQPKWQIVLTKTMNEKMIVENVTTGQNYVYANSIQGIGEGSIFAIMNNASGFVSFYEVDAVNTKWNSSKKGFKVVFKSAINSTDVTTANYARLCQFDTDNQIIIPFTNSEWNIDTIVERLNKLQKEFEFFKDAAAVSTPASTNGDVFIGMISGATKGRNPAATSTDYLNIAAAFPDWSDEFLNLNKVNIRIIGLANPDTAIHAAFKTLAQKMGSFNFRKPIGLVLGNDLNETADDCVVRLKAMNYDHTLLALGGDNDEPAYISTAPQVFGTILKNSVTHNLTRDPMDMIKPEKNWSSTEKVKLLKAGGLIFLPSQFGYRIARGLTTYQDQNAAWNEQDGQSYLWQQVQVSDFFFKGFLDEMDRRAVGADNLSQEDVQVMANGIIVSYQSQGYITSGTVQEVKRVESGWIVKILVKIPGVTDFIGVICYLQSE